MKDDYMFGIPDTMLLADIMRTTRRDVSLKDDFKFGGVGDPLVDPQVLAAIRKDIADRANKMVATVMAAPATPQRPVTVDDHAQLLHRYLNMIGAIDDDGRATA